MIAGYLQFKPAFCDAKRNIERIYELTRNIDFDLLVMPELSNSGYLFTEKEQLAHASETIPGGIFCRALAKLAKEKNAFIVCGLAEKAGNKFYNSSVLVNPNGEIKTYRKIHLFNEERLWFTPGDGRFEVFDINSAGSKVKIGMMICYDWLYPEAARSLAIQGAQIICHPSNLVMPYCQNAMYARAVENRVFTITANRVGTDKNNGNELSFTGQSVMLDPKGNYLSRASEGGEECFAAEIDPSMALNKKMNDYNSIFEDLRRDKYIL
jgi:predicted amidohydrolase